MAQLERLAGNARMPGKPLGAFDTAQFAYKVSKTGLNQGAPPAASYLGYAQPLIASRKCELHRIYCWQSCPATQQHELATPVALPRN